MSEYKTDYGALEDGSATTADYANGIDQKVEEMSTVVKKLDNDSVFMGPVRDTCIDAYNVVSTSLSNVAVSYKSLAQSIDAASATYNAGDVSASDKITSE